MILGPAGIGKSTLARAALYHPDVVDRYGDRRYLARLDATPSADAAVNAIADTLGVPADPDLAAAVAAALRVRRTLLVLDNAETPWEQDRDAVEKLLGDIAGIEGVAVVVSVRGAVRPGGVAWRDAIKVEPLDDPDAINLFCAIAGEEHRSDPGLPMLLGAQEGVPLALTLLGHVAEGGSIRSVAGEWSKQRTALLARPGGRDRLTSWAVSLELSIGSRRMTPTARRLLALLATLPDGIAEMDLEELLPGKGRAAALRLGQVGLARFERKRLLVLAPVREYVARERPARADDLNGAIQWYTRLATTEGPKVGGENGAEAASRLALETANLDAMIRRALLGPTPRLRVIGIDAVSKLSSFMVHSGRISPQLMEAAVSTANGEKDARRESHCVMLLAKVLEHRSSYDRARGLFEVAVTMFQRLGDQSCEASSVEYLGRIASAQGKPEEARKRFESAILLYRRAGNPRGEATCIQALGGLSLSAGKHSDARSRYETALPIIKKAGSVLGEAYHIVSLGEMHYARGRLADAKSSFEAALEIYRKAGASLGEANCMFSLGVVAQKRSDLPTAAALYETASRLYQSVGNDRGEANCAYRLGDIASLRSQGAQARARLQAALELYAKIPDLYSVAKVHIRLARISRGMATRWRHLVAGFDAFARADNEHLQSGLASQLRHVLHRLRTRTWWLIPIALVLVMAGYLILGIR